MNITRDQARCFILGKQGLLGRYRFVGKNGAYQYFRTSGGKPSVLPPQSH